jgi:hypothetical protein
MPSLSLLKRSARGSSEAEDRDRSQLQPTPKKCLRGPGTSSTPGVSTEGGGRRCSKREMIQNLLSRNPLKPRASVSGASDIRSRTQSLRSGAVSVCFFSMVLDDWVSRFRSLALFLLCSPNFKLMPLCPLPGMMFHHMSCALTTRGEVG